MEEEAPKKTIEDILELLGVEDIDRAYGDIKYLLAEREELRRSDRALTDICHILKLYRGNVVDAAKELRLRTLSAELEVYKLEEQLRGEERSPRNFWSVFLMKYGNLPPGEDIHVCDTYDGELVLRPYDKK